MRATMFRSSGKWAWLPLCIAACSEAPEPPAPPEVQAGSWSNQEEVLHQTRALMRYEDEQQRVKLERLRELGVSE
jgi:hypothetical protein